MVAPPPSGGQILSVPSRLTVTLVEGSSRWNRNRGRRDRHCHAKGSRPYHAHADSRRAMIPEQLSLDDIRDCPSWTETPQTFSSNVAQQNAAEVPPDKLA